MSTRKSNHFAGDPIVAAYEKLQEELKDRSLSEQYLSEASNSKFALKLAGKWHEEVPLPWKDNKDLHNAIKGGKNIHALTQWFASNQRPGQSKKIEIESVEGKMSGSVLRVEIKWIYTDSLKEGYKTTTIEIQDD